MIDLTLYTKDNAPEASRKILGSLEESFGFIPNVLRRLAAAPAALGATAQLLGLLEQTSLTTTEQQVVLLVVARQNTSEYCVAANSSVAQMKGVPADVIAAIRTGEPLADPRLEALRLFAAEMVRERGQASEETTRAFFKAGFREDQVLEVILGIATETMASFTDRVSGIPIDAEFEANVWRPAESA